MSRAGAATTSSEEKMSIDWLDVLKISISSSVLTTFVGWGLNHVFVHRATLKRDARYLPQRLILEKYAAVCATTIADSQLAGSSAGHAGKHHLTLPVIGPFPAMNACMTA
jgi:hypothetical protein